VVTQGRCYHPPGVGLAEVTKDRRFGARLPRRRDELPPAPVPGPAPADIVELTSCSICGHPEWAAVCEYNRFLVNGLAPDEAAMRADYALCRRCGIVFARRRPVGARFRHMLERFEETLGRDGEEHRGTRVLGSGALTDSEVADLRARIAHPMFAGEYPRVKDRVHLPHLLRDRLAVAPHVEILSSLVTLNAPRVLELRPRFGAIGASLRRLFGGETFALPLFEVQQFLVREVYGTRADSLLDYDSFSIPYDGAFDLIVANHLLTHAVRPADALATVRQHLAPGGHVYLYNEPDEADFLETGKSIFNTLNAFHLQTFEAQSLARALLATGFEPLFVGHHEGNLVALARVASDQPRWKGISDRELGRRLEKYAAARDRSILALPDDARRYFAEEWEVLVQRGLAAGLLGIDADGYLRVVKAPKD
jgi:SAM-dependent methyltransferase